MKWNAFQINEMYTLWNEKYHEKRLVCQLMCGAGVLYKGNCGQLCDQCLYFNTMIWLSVDSVTDGSFWHWNSQHKQIILNLKMLKLVYSRTEQSVTHGSQMALEVPALPHHYGSIRDWWHQLIWRPTWQQAVEGWVSWPPILLLPPPLHADGHLIGHLLLAGCCSDERLSRSLCCGSLL